MMNRDVQTRGRALSWMARWGRFFATLGLSLGVAACGLVEGEDAQASSASAALSMSGHVTGLCGYSPPLPGGFQGSSPAGPCEGVCNSTWTHGSCVDPADAASHVQVYGCPGKTAGQACDGYTNNGVLIADLYSAGTVSISDFWHLTQYCTFQLDVLRPTATDPIGLRDFIIWERDECEVEDPNQPPVCVPRSPAVCAPAGQCVAHVNVNGGSYDPDGDPLTVTQTPPGPYSIGITPVQLRVSDGQDTRSCGASVTVKDCEPPVIVCPEAVVAECMGDGRATVDPGDATATDLCSPPVTVTDPGPGEYPLGTTPVEYTAKDGAGNTASCTGSVTVQDTTPPVIIVEESPVLWPPNHEYQRISLADCARAVDQCQGELPVTSGEILCVTSDEDDDARGGGDGHTTQDIVIIDGQFVDLRSERAGSGNGRVYTITYQFTDAAGNVATGTCEVGVPHSNSGDPAIADEPVENVCRSPTAAQAASLAARQRLVCGSR